MAKQAQNDTNKRGDNKETFSVAMPNSPDMPANYRKFDKEQKSKN